MEIKILPNDIDKIQYWKNDYCKQKELLLNLVYYYLLKGGF